MSNCSICGRALSNPASIAAGVGPICGGRGYRNRIAGRFGNPRWGWSEIAEWEVVNHPCYSCKHFRFPNKGKELTLEDGNRRVSFPAKDPYTGKRPLNRATGREEIKTFPPKAIGGLCRYLNELVDGNQIREDAACTGRHYVARKKKSEQPKVGLLKTRNGLGGNPQFELFKPNEDD